MKGLFNQWFSSFNKEQPKPVTYFAHVPKTAGTSFIALLDRFFTEKNIFPQQLWREIKHIDKSANYAYDLYRGHFGGGGLDVLTDRNIDFLTLLRHPIDLAQSTYEYVLREKNTKVHELVKDQNMSFDDFIAHPTTQPLIKNRMIRNISFDFKADPAAQEVFLSAETIEFLQSLMAQTKTQINDDQRLIRAKRFLEQCRWFGLQEDFDASMQLLCFEMKWPPIGPSQRLNTYDDKAELTVATKIELAAINQHDFDLYQYAEQLFQEKQSTMISALEIYRTNTLQRIDDLLDVHYQNHYEKPLQEFIKYDFGEVLLGSQWHRRELMQPENEYFRWTGPEIQSSIDFWLNPHDYLISLRIINAVSTEALDGLKVALNGHELTWETVDQGVVRILNLACQKAMIAQNGLARLTFNTQHVKSHSEAFESDDERLVGIAVHWIQFNHV